MYSLLIVDDERTTRDCLREHIPWFELGVSNVHTAKNGLEALALAQRCKPDIMITDVRMPKMDGLSLARQVHLLHPDCRIIFLSGYADKDYLKSAIRVKAVCYLEKPININEIIKEIRELHLIRQEDPLSFPVKQEDHKILMIKEYINQNYTNNQLSICSIAAHIGLSQTYLCEYFKKVLNKTINEFITELRINKAKELLVGKQSRLHEIAACVGYSDPNYFSTLFKKYVGCTPSEFRLRYLP